MYAGHLGLGLAATRVRPDVPIAAYLVAAVAPDLLVASTFHTAPAIVLLACIGYGIGRMRFNHEVGLILAILVLSHFLVDLFTSSLAIWPNGPEAGLRLYDTPIIDFLIEGAVIVGGWSLWRSGRRGGDTTQLPKMLVLLLVAQALFAVFIAGDANG